MSGTIEQTIDQVERLYHAVTGQPPPPANGPHAPIPPEVDPTRHVNEQLDKLLELMGTPVGATAAAAPPPSWVPPVLVWEEEQATILAFDVPGVPRETVEVIASRDQLAIRGERPAPWGDSPRSAATVRGVERPVGRFARVITLPRAIAPERITATLIDGVLEVRLPRLPPSGGLELRVPVK